MNFFNSSGADAKKLAEPLNQTDSPFDAFGDKKITERLNHKNYSFEQTDPSCERSVIF